MPTLFENIPLQKNIYVILYFLYKYVKKINWVNQNSCHLLKLEKVLRSKIFHSLYLVILFYFFLICQNRYNSVLHTFVKLFRIFSILCFVSFWSNINFSWITYLLGRLALSLLFLFPLSCIIKIHSLHITKLSIKLWPQRHKNPKQ